MTPTIESVSDIDVRVEAQPLTHPDSPTLLYSVEDSTFTAFETALDEDPTVDEWRATMVFSECRVYQVHPSLDAKFTLPKIAELGVQVLSIQNSDRRWQFRLQAPDKAALGAYWEYCRDEGVSFTLEKLYRSGPQTTTGDIERLTSRLTDRQREVARTATRMGYYDSEGASAEAVAAELDISPSTLSTHLRRITAKLFEEIFGE